MASNSSSTEHVVYPGPINKHLLKLQMKHVSEHVWAGKPDRTLNVRRAKLRHNGHSGISQRLAGYLERAGFLSVAQLGYFPTGTALISALVERWRPETHTFHMTMGESTITLQDVALLLELRVDGFPIVGTTTANWKVIILELLGVTPPSDAIRGNSIKMKYLDTVFSDINEDSCELVRFEQYVRAYILRLIGGLLFVDGSSSRVPLRYLLFLRDFD